jgi:hypothetical protein
MVVEIGDFERCYCDGLAVRKLEESAVGGGDRGADFFPGGVRGETVGPHHAHEGLTDHAAVGVTAVDRGHERPRIDDVRAGGQRIHADLWQAPDPSPLTRARCLALQRADQSNRNRRGAFRFAELADQIHRLSLV